MSLTHFPNGVSSFGSPVVPYPGIVPSTTSGQGQTPGGVYFVNGDIGNDGYQGTNPTRPFLTLDRAYNACYGGRNEIIYVLAGAASVNFSSAIASGGAGLVWAKNQTHLIGLGGPSIIGQRAHISNGASTNLYTPLIQVSGNGCVFQNIELFNGGNDTTKAAVCLSVTGQRFTAINCQISGGGHATSAGNAAMRSLLIGGTTGGTGTGTSDENYFDHCYIGLDTESRSSTSTEIEILGGSARTVFENCVFSTYGTGGNLFLTIGANGIDRFCLFRNSMFVNASTFSGGTALSNAFALNAAPGGIVLMNNVLIFGATATAATKTALYFDNAYATTTTGKAVIAGW